jgi:hypothetical protein
MKAQLNPRQRKKVAASAEPTEVPLNDVQLE